MNEVLKRILGSRGVAANEVLDVATLPDYRSLKGINEAVTILANAIATEQSILIMSDYDCDGATGAAVMVRGLSHLGAHVDFLVPSRLTEGYGLTPDVVQRIVADGKIPDVLVTVDNGISSVQGVADAKQQGMKVIVTDHHLAPDVLPLADAIVNPNQPGCEFPMKGLCGCGVGWYVLRALAEHLGKRLPEELIQLVAVATISDMVPMTDVNNRAIVAEGMEQIRAGRGLPGLTVLAEVVGRNPRYLGTTDIGFAIGPHINAAGRMSDASVAVRALITDDDNVAREYTLDLARVNSERKAAQKLVTDDAMAAIAIPEQDGRFTAVVSDASFHVGVIGLAASRIKDALYRPTFVFADNGEGVMKGSGRSIAGLNLKDALAEIDAKFPGMFLSFGGHAMAAGATIRAEQIEAFSTTFEAIARRLLTEDDLNPKSHNDGVLAADEFTLDTAEALRSYPWGNGFPEPVFQAEFSVRDQKPLSNGAHVKGSLVPEGSTRAIDAIAFGRGDLPAQFSGMFQLGINVWKNNVKLQLMLQGVN